MIKSAIVASLLLVSQVFATSEIKEGDRCINTPANMFGDGNIVCIDGNPISALFTCVPDSLNSMNGKWKKETCGYCCSKLNHLGIHCTNSKDQCENPFGKLEK